MPNTSPSSRPTVGPDNALQQNIAALDVGDRVRLVTASALAVAASLDVDLVFADPPYGFDDWATLLDALAAGVHGPPSLVVAESARPIDAVGGWDVTRVKRYGRTWVTFLQPPDK